jgi:hypothetical protein
LRNADRFQGAPGLDLILHPPQRSEIRNHSRHIEPGMQRGKHRHLFLRRQQHVDVARFGDTVRRLEPRQRIVGEARHAVECTDMTGETGQANRRRRQDFDVMPESAQSVGDLARG